MDQTMKPSTISEGSVCRHLDDVTIVIKTFERPDMLRMSLEFLRMYYPDIPVIVIDDSEIGLDPDSFDDKIRYIHTEHNIGLSEGRNRGVALSKTEFTFVMDDDFVFTPNSRLDLLRQPLITGGFAIAGSRMINYGHDEVIFHGRLVEMGSKILFEKEKIWGTLRGYPIVDCCHNILMARTSFLKENPWTPELKLREHWDFFYRIKKKKAGLVTIRPETEFHHYPERPKRYFQFRRDKNTLDYVQLSLELHNKTEFEMLSSYRMEMIKEYIPHRLTLSRIFKNRRNKKKQARTK